MDEAGFETAHIAGNSLGGYVALQLAARGRARSVVALAPAGGWAADDQSFARHARATSTTMHEQVRAAAPHAEAIAATPEGRRRATRAHRRRNFEHIPAELVAHQIRGAADCDAVAPLIEFALREGCTARRRADHVPGARRVGHGRPAAALAAGRRALPRRTGCRTPTGSSSTASATARSSTSRSRRRS